MKHWLKHHWRSLLARLPLPMLALAASYGVYRFALLFTPDWVAVVQAAAFETTYIGLAVTRGLDQAGRRRATTISLGAVVASIIYNTLAGWFHAQPGVLDTANPIAWLCLAILHGAPLAWVAFLVASLLLHQQGGRRDLRPQRRAFVRRLTGALRSSREQAAQSQVEIARLTSSLAQMQAAAAQPDPLLAQQAVEITRLQELRARFEQEIVQQARESADLLRSRDQEIAQLQEAAAQADRQLAQLLTAGDVDRLAVARRLRMHGDSLRESAKLLRMPESTLRERLKETNGHHAEVTP